MEVTSSTAGGTKLSGGQPGLGERAFLRDPPVQEEALLHPTCSVSVGNPSYLVSEFLSSGTSNVNASSASSIQNGRLHSGGSSLTSGGAVDFEGIDLNAEVPLGEILEKLQESSSSSSIISSSSSSEEEDLKRRRSSGSSQINNNVIQLHAEKEDLSGATISATVNVSTLDLSDPEAIHRHLSQLNDTVLKVIPNPGPPPPTPRLLQPPSISGTPPSSSIRFLPGPKAASNRRSSSGGKSSPQVCGICSKVFSNASALAKHRLTHSEERRYHCSICGKAFKRQDHLNGHLLTHRSTKPFACNVEGCGKSYCDARSLRRHKENHHPQAPEQRSNGTSSGVVNGTVNVNNTGSNSNNNNHNLLDSIKFSGKGLTPQQFQLIEQIIKESKEGAAAAAAIAAGSTGGTPGSKALLSSSGAQTPQTPVECAICGRKFKNIPALNGHMRLHGGYYKKDADGRRIPSLTEAALLQQQSLSEKNPSKRSISQNILPLDSAGTNENSSGSSGITAFRSLPPPDTTKLLANLERKAIEFQQHQPMQSLQFNPNNNADLHLKYPKKRRKKSSETESQVAFLPRAPLPPNSPSVIKLGSQQSLHSKNSSLDVLKYDVTADKSPRIGPEYQASVPEHCSEPFSDLMDENPSEESEIEEADLEDSSQDRVLWKSKYDENMDEEELLAYLSFGRSSGVPRGDRRSLEFALYTLMRHRGDTKSALRDLLLDVKTDERELSMVWSEAEISGFFSALSEYQKDFRALSSYIGTKSVSQCVEFYYFWKNLRLREDSSSSAPTTPNNQLSTTTTTTTLINGSITTIGDPMELIKEGESCLPSIHGILY